MSAPLTSPDQMTAETPAARTATPPAPAGLTPLAGLAVLGSLNAETPLSAEDLARLIGCCTATIDRATTRGELPAPYLFRGRRRWQVGTILEHLAGLQKDAIKAAAEQAARRKAHQLAEKP